MHIFIYCMLRIGVSKIYVVSYIYQFVLRNLTWIFIRGVEPNNGKIVPKIELAKWRLIGISFPWEVLPPWQVFMWPSRPTQCNIPIEKIDIFKERCANDRSISYEHLSGWGNLSRENNSNLTSLFRILTNETFSENFKLSLWEFDYGLFTKLPRMIVAYDFSPNSFKLKRGILPLLTN